MSYSENPFAAPKSASNTGQDIDSAAGKRPFGLWSCVALVVANMIGAGVYTSSGFAMGSVDNRAIVMVAWLVGGIIALCGAISYGGLARHMSESGGEYLFLTRTVHPLAGFMAGWISLIAGFTGAIAFAALAFAEYAVPGQDQYVKPLAIGVIVVFGLMHLVREPGVWVQNMVVAVKLLVIGGLIVFAFAKFGSWPGHNLDSPPSSPFNISVFATQIMWFSLSYSGYNAAVYISSEVKDPERTVPRSMWIATLIVTGLYLVLNYIFVFGPDPAAIVNQPKVAMVAADAVGGTLLSRLIQITICLSLASSVSAMVIAGPRVYARMADDGVFPRVFRFNENNATAAILLQVVLASIVVWISTLKDLIDYLSLILAVSTAATVASLFVLRAKGTVIRMFGFPFIPALYVIVTMTLAAIRCTTQDSAGQWKATIGTVVLGLVAYGLTRLKRPQTYPGNSA
ncbi:MAG: APC family permease [Planctomycetaceae bacterium]